MLSVRQKVPPAGQKVFTAMRCCFSQNYPMSFPFLFSEAQWKPPNSVLCVGANRPRMVSSFVIPTCPFASSKTIGVHRWRELADHFVEPVVELPCSAFPHLRIFVCVLVSEQKADVAGTRDDPNCANASSQFRRSCPYFANWFPCAYLRASRNCAPCGPFASVPLFSAKGSAHVLCDSQVVLGLGSHKLQLPDTT